MGASEYWRCTPAYDKHYHVIGAMGERFLLYRTGTKDAQAVGLRAQKMVGREDKIVRDTSGNSRFINQFENLGDVKLKPNEGIYHQIVSLACFCAYGRCPVERDYKNQCILYEPQPEGPARLTKQFTQMAVALALVQDKPGVDDDVYSVVKKIGRDLLPVQRRHILEFLWIINTGRIFQLGQYNRRGGCGRLPAATTRLLLEDLMTTGCCP